MIKLLLKPTPDPTLLEEIIDASTHGIGVLLSITALVILVTYSSLQDDAWKIVSSAVFGSTLIIAYLSSTLYHLVQTPNIKRLFKLCDHLSIYLLIAGTYTPLTLVSLRHNYGWYLFTAIWGLAIAGIILKLFFSYRFRKLSTITYLLMGWLAVVAVEPIFKTLPFNAILWLLAGGLSYSLGVIFFVSDRLKYSHTIWHIFVLGGSFCHFFAILYYVILP